MSNSRNSKIKTPEHTMQKRLTYVAVGSLCATPFIGPAGLVVFSAIMTGKVLRPIVNAKARRDYTEESRLMKQQKEQKERQRNYNPSPICSPSRPCYPSSSSTTYTYPDTPKTALAKRIPRKTLSLLEKESEKRHYDAELACGADIVNTYLNRISKKEVESINEITILPGKEKRFLGIPLGRKPLEVKIKND
jgi:hypothetical protein